MIRSLFELSSRQVRRGIPWQVFGQRSCLSSRREFSSAPRKNGPSEPAKPGRPPESGSSFPTYIIGGVAIGTAIMAAYKSGYLDQIVGEEKRDSLGPSVVVFDEKDKKTIHQDAQPVEHVGEEKVSEVLQELSPKNDDAGKVETPSVAPHLETLNGREVKDQSHVEEKSEAALGKGKVVDQEKDLPISSEVSTKESMDSGILSEARPDMQNPSTLKQPGEEVPVEQSASQVNSVTNPDEVKPVQQHDRGAEGRQEDASGPNIGTPSSLLEAYHLQDKSEERTSASRGRYAENEAFAGVTTELDDSVATKDGKLILDFLQAIHAAEKRQAELDARVFAEEKRAMKDKYEKELKDAIARELMHAEEAALLDKELKRERAKAVATVQALQQKLEEKHKMELQQKEAESELKLKKVEELAKAETAAMIAREKAAQIEKMAEANLHINALCMAFYARSEEARRSHSVHKLALGTLALEDALSEGLPIKAELEAMQTYLEGIDKDSVLDLVFSSLPEETVYHGADTVLQLNNQFDTLKGTLRHYSLIPPGGGGILAHSLARIASWLKVKHGGDSGEGIESLINKVESYLSEGKLAEAADALEEGLEGSQAAEIVDAWVRQARNRAIAEQALTLLQSYATSVSLT